MTEAAIKSLDDEIVSNLVQAILGESKPAETPQSADLGPLAKGLAGDLTGSLSAIVPGIDCWVRGLEPCRYSGFISQPDPSMFVLARPGDERGLILVSLGAETLDWWVTCSLGGTPAGGVPPRQDFTNMEVRVGRVALDLGLGGLVRVLSSFGIDLSFRECRAAATVKDLPPMSDDPMGYGVRIGLSPNSDAQFISLFVTEDLGRQWSDVLASRQSADSPAQGKSHEVGMAAAFETHLAGVSVEIVAVLVAEPVELDELLSWAPGGVVPLRASTESLVRLTSNDVPLFSGRLGKIDGRLCVQIGSPIDSSEGALDDQLHPI